MHGIPIDFQWFNGTLLHIFIAGIQTRAFYIIAWWQSSS